MEVLPFRVIDRHMKKDYDKRGIVYCNTCVH